MNFCLWHRHWRRAYCSAHFFFGGLWWTIIRGVSSERPALWFFGSVLLRMSLTLAGFYFVGRDNWERWLLCLLGFLLARFAVKWLNPSAGRTRQLPGPGDQVCALVRMR
jgi:F1F0 ATPase subunit 2